MGTIHRRLGREGQSKGRALGGRPFGPLFHLAITMLPSAAAVSSVLARVMDRLQSVNRVGGSASVTRDAGARVGQPSRRVK